MKVPLHTVDMAMDSQSMRATYTIFKIQSSSPTKSALASNPCLEQIPWDSLAGLTPRGGGPGPATRWPARPPTGLSRGPATEGSTRAPHQ